MPSADVAVVGGGIAGLAHAWEAARSGRRVVLFERDHAAKGASIRNFGMVWPIGQPAGDRLQLALASREIWLEVAGRAGLDVVSTGSLHVAYQPDEADVIHEFAEAGPKVGYRCRWMDPDQALAAAPALRKEGLLGALWSETEVVVDPRQVVLKLPDYLAETFGVQLRTGAAVRSIALPKVETAEEIWEVDQAIVCGGDDFATLYPSVLAASGLFRVKLQMMRTGPQPAGWSLGPAIAAGLTLRFYPSFRLCGTLGALEKRIAAEPEPYDRFGIHVMASQTPAGQITLGDSHVYGEEISVFDQPYIDEVILAYAKRFLHLPLPRIAERWHGIYSKHPELPYFHAEPEPGVHIVTGLGGAGMTLSFGLASTHWESWK